MTQLELCLDASPEFDGDTYDERLDRSRLTGQLQRVYALMSDGVWRTLPEIEAVTGGTAASVSARLRDLRKEKFGAHTVEARRLRQGLYVYRVVVK